MNHYYAQNYASIMFTTLVLAQITVLIDIFKPVHVNKIINCTMASSDDVKGPDKS